MPGAVEVVKTCVKILHSCTALKCCAGLQAYHRSGIAPLAAGERLTFLNLYRHEGMWNELEDRMQLEGLQQETVALLMRTLHQHDPVVKLFRCIEMSLFRSYINNILDANMLFSNTFCGCAPCLLYTIACSGNTSLA